jgi:hypothetical protein
VYGGWQKSRTARSRWPRRRTDHGARALCENGRPVPLDREDFRKAAQGLAEAGEAAYKAAQSKNLDAMVEVSETVSNACATCHEPYRDFDDPKDRCKGPAAAAE